MPEHNARFAVPPEQPGSAFVRYRGLYLQLPESPLRPHFVKAKVRVHEYPDGHLAVFHGPRQLACYRPDGTLIEEQTRAAA